MSFLSKKSHKEAFSDILDRKECFLDLKSEVLKKSKKSTFCKVVSPWFLSKNRPFPYMFFFSKKSKKETFFYILDRKQCFLDLKGEVLAKSQKSIFCIGVSPWFLAKNRPFSYNFFFEQKARKKYFLIFWIENKVFLTFKVKFSQSLKKRHFAKGLVHGFLKKIDLFFIRFFFFSKKMQKKTFFDIRDRKECFLDLKSEILKKSKKSTFCKGVSPWFF